MSDLIDHQLVQPYNVAAALRELRQALPGRVFVAGEPTAADLVPAFNTAWRHRAPLIVTPSKPADVSAVVQIAGRQSLTVKAIGTGHGLLGPVDAGIILVTRGLSSVEVDAETRVARIGAGARWQDVLDAAAPHGLAPLAGSAPHVGVVGYLLGGGLGPIARQFGFAADHVREIEVVTGVGEHLIVNAESHADLFWALRGGKVGLGIVVSVTIDLFPLATLWGGGVYFAAPDIEPVLHAWNDWSAALPEEFGTSAAILRLPPAPFIPEPLRGQTVLHVRVAYTGTAAEGERLLAPLRAVRTPLLERVADLPYAQLGAIHQDPAEPMPYTEGGVLLRDLDDAALDALLAAVGPDAPVPLAAVELRLLGGAVARPAGAPNAIAGRDAAFALHIVGAPVPELLDTVIPAVIEGVFSAMHPWVAEELQPNFVGPANPGEHRDRIWAPDTARRLDAVRAGYDPFRVFA
ncbi:FAD/FMN-containing dehydrogenase [Diaminobutyricimonas aerilata]|uniref:FAD/FMN-containing dehydrogenase n=1 Tax=Diaminobutyricimonas aerilata TaxID=1162967 RepID=A0A2M9CM46_9MICO|nr:FAD-binding protein [Diaminobutyricimonas aerilata]PJJ72962.1 FAD/FMN-containing dehydrogenase [Diaminobutyricimonas aerilata]